MSNLFSLQNIMNESALTARSLIKTPIVETYLDSSIMVLKELYDGMDKIKTGLYSSLLESSTRKQENEKFAEYFKQYKQLISKFQRDMNELVSRFSINVDTFVDANKALIKDMEDTDLNNAPMIKVYKYENLSNSDIPHVDVYKAFKHEFKFIAQMMQDLGSAITDDEVKAKVLATVCNNLSKDISDGWLEKCMEKIIDCDDCSKDNFASLVYKKFIPGVKEDVSVTAGEVQQARLSLMNASSYVADIEKAAEKFNVGLDKVASEIGAMFFRNQDKEMHIKTDVEGLADRNYHLTDYSFNQFNIFMATKCTQITEICNLYLIALGIKSDCIFKYLQQCKDIIEAAYHGVDNTPNTDNDPGEDNNMDDIDDDIQDDSTDGFEAPDMDGIENKDLDDAPTPSEEDGESREPVQDDSVDEVEQEMEESAYLFEAITFAADRLISEQYISESIQCLIEADLEKLNNASKNAKSSFIESFVQQIFNLINKFKKVFADGLTGRIDRIKKYQNSIKGVEIPNNWKQDFIDTDKLTKIDIRDFNYTSDKDKLVDEQTYINAFWKDYLTDEDKSIKDRMLNKLMTVDTPYTGTQRDKGIAFLLGYESHMKSLDAQLNTLKQAQTKAKSIAKNVNESVTSLEEAMVMYFNEADAAPMPEKNDTNNNSGNQNTDNNPSNTPGDNNTAKNTQDNTKAVKLYFSVNTKIMAAKMAIMQQAAKSHLNFLEKLLEISGAAKDNNS